MSQLARLRVSRSLRLVEDQHTQHGSGENLQLIGHLVDRPTEVRQADEQQIVLHLGRGHAREDDTPEVSEPKTVLWGRRSTKRLVVGCLLFNPSKSSMDLLKGISTCGSDAKATTRGHRARGGVWFLSEWSSRAVNGVSGH